MPRFTLAEVDEILAEHAPGTRDTMVVDDLGDGRVLVRMRAAGAQLRPGDTVSGPSQMVLADFALWVAVLAEVGRPAVHAVTTHLSMDFLRRPAPVDLLGDCSLLKLGRRLAVGSVVLRSEGDDRPVAHASVTYAIPPPPAAADGGPAGR